MPRYQSVLFFLVISASPGVAQMEQWEARVDSMLSAGVEDYAVITSIMYQYRYDSLAMDHLLRSSRKVGNASAESFALNRLGTRHRRNSRVDSAFALHLKAYQAAKAAESILGQIVALNSRGIAYRNSGRVTEALDAHKAAIDLTKEVETLDSETLRALAISLDSKGRIHLRLDQLDEAEQDFKASMDIERRINSTLGLAINNYNLASISEKRGEYDKATKYYRQALTFNAEINSQLGKAINYIGMSRVLNATGSFNAALNYARDAVPILEKEKSYFYLTTAELAYGDVLISTNNYSVAEVHLERSKALAEKYEYVEEYSKIYFAFVRLEEARGNVSKALAYYKLAYDAREAVLNEKNQRYVAALSARYSNELKEAEILRLARENELVREKSRRTTRNAIGLVGILSFVAIILAFLYRQRKLVLQRDLVNLEQRRLASQMNPHFLFNALNSVKSYLISNQGSEAIEYLTKFAKLMRRILSSTIDEEVPLGEEIENSKLYVAVENARFNEEINFEVRVDESVQLTSTLVPPLMLQPFLENALWHGLRMKEGEKNLSLEVDHNLNNELTITIRDNGIGRAAAKANNTGHTVNRKSVGLEITGQRLQHFASKQGKTATFGIRDLVLPTGEPGGTEVVIRIV